MCSLRLSVNLESPRTLIVLARPKRTGELVELKLGIGAEESIEVEVELVCSVIETGLRRQPATAGFTLDDLHHRFTNSTGMRRGSIGCLLDLILCYFSFPFSFSTASTHPLIDPLHDTSR